jgi:hypothetical protein
MTLRFDFRGIPIALRLSQGFVVNKKQPNGPFARLGHHQKELVFIGEDHPIQDTLCHWEVEGV